MSQQFNVDKLVDLVNPIVEGMEYELYHLEFVKENGENYLRVYIDKEEGIKLDDCEKVSRAVSDMLDIEDPIEESYYLEVSSPGIERQLYTDLHLKKYTDFNIVIKLKSLFNGKRSFEGILRSFNAESLVVECEGDELIIPRDNIKRINLVSEF